MGVTGGTHGAVPDGGPQAAVFDLDGTLISSEARNRAVWEQFLDRYGLILDDELAARFSGRRGLDVLADHAHLFPGRSVEQLGAEVDELDSTLTGPGLTPVPGAVELVRRLSAAGLPLALVTSATRGYADERLAELGLVGRFDVEVTAELVKVGKPDPAGFALACRELDVTPGRSVGFEDSLAGIAAVKAAGLWCVGLATSLPASALTEADLVVPHLIDLPWPPPVGPWALSAR